MAENIIYTGNIFEGNMNKRRAVKKRINNMTKRAERNMDQLKFWMPLPREGSFFELTNENRERMRLSNMPKNANARPASLKRSTATRNLRSLVNRMNNNNNKNKNANANENADAVIARLLMHLNSKKSKTNNKAIQGLLRLLNAANK
jgi:hypothetical protein